ncbi:hypothetical protein G3O00_39310 [Burkholderia sp. Ac-20384]|nr:hypothetical protein [Burkholderia sp. Ac-20384]
MLSQSDRSILRTLFSHIREEDFIALSPAARQEYVENFTPSAKLSIRGSRVTTRRKLRNQIQTALRKQGLLPAGIPRSNAERPADEQAALEKITLENRKIILGGFMSDLRKQGSSITLFEHMTPEQRQIHIDNYLLRKGTTIKNGLPNVLKELGLSGTGQ